jgi:hypothetical protein
VTIGGSTSGSGLAEAETNLPYFNFATSIGVLSVSASGFRFPPLNFIFLYFLIAEFLEKGGGGYGGEGVRVSVKERDTYRWTDERWIGR